VEFAGEDRAALLARLRQLVELMGDLGLPGSVVEMPDEAAAEGAVGSAQGRPEHHDELKGDGKPVSFIEDCAVPLEHWPSTPTR
jgi:hypothetical protein